MAKKYFVYASGNEIHALLVSDERGLLTTLDEIRDHVERQFGGAPWVGDFSSKQQSEEAAVREMVAEFAQTALDYQTENPVRAAKLTLPTGATYVGTNSKLTHLGFGTMG